MASERIKEFTGANFQTEVLEAKKPVLVDFWAPWCGPCRMVAPHVEAVAQELGEQVIVGKVNVDDHPALAQKYGVMSIPTLVVIVEGEMVEREVGARAKDGILAMLRQHIEA
jgi:thioredoxin 1